MMSMLGEADDTPRSLVTVLWSCGTSPEPTSDYVLGEHIKGLFSTHRRQLNTVLSETGHKGP